MKRHLIIKFFALGVAIFTATSCLNSNITNFPAGAGGTFIMMTYNTGPNIPNTNSGLDPSFFPLEIFGSPTGVPFSFSDSVDYIGFAVTLQGNTFSKDINVTVKVDNTKLQDNLANDSTTFTALPDSTYVISTTTGVIKAGTTYASFVLTVYPYKIDGNQNYMLPITATNDAGIQLSANYGVIYAHQYANGGNPMSGVYKSTYREWVSTNTNLPDTTAAVTSTSSSTQTFFADDPGSSPTTVEIQSGYGTQNGFKFRYQLSFVVNSDSTLNKFAVQMNPNDVAFAVSNGVNVIAGPTLLDKAPDRKHFTLTYSVFDATHTARTFIDDFVLQP